MTKAHIGSVLPIKNRVLSVDEHCAALFHYDLNEHDVLRGIKASGQENAVSFNNTVGSYAQVTYSGDLLEGMPQLTLEARVRSRAITGGYGRIISIWAEGQAYQLFILTAGIAFEVKGTNGQTWFYGGPNITTDNQWHHIAGVYDGVNMIIYLDGVEVARKAAAFGRIANVGSNTLGIGSYNNGASYAMDGEVAEVRIWSSARTPEQINEYMNKPLQNEQPGLLGYWKCNEGDGSIIRDSSPFHNDGIVYGGGWKQGNSVFTLRPQEGKFGGGIAIEEGTTNHVANGNFEKSFNDYWIHSAYNGSYHTHESRIISDETNNVLYVKKVNEDPNNQGYLRIINKIDAEATEGETISFHGWCKILSIESGSPAIAFQKGPATKAHAWPDTSLIGVWQHVSGQYTIPAGESGADYHVYLHYLQGHNGECLWKNVQWENKPFATSFVDGSREDGNLIYPSHVFNHDEGTINLWVSSIHDVGVMPSGTGISQGDRPFIYPESGSDWSYDNGVFLWYLNDGDQLYALFAGKTLAGTDGLTWPAYEWHMMTLSWSKSNNYVKMHMDGSPIAIQSFPATSWNNKTNYKLGHVNSNFLFDELRIDKIARTDEEILAWYESNSPFWPRGIYRKSY